MPLLDDIYLETLARCAPQVLVRKTLRSDFPRHVVAIGKCAGALFDGVAGVLDIESAFVTIPKGYPPPKHKAPALEIAIGGHPDFTPESFDAGARLLAYVERHEDVLFLISGGGSACVERPLPPFTERDLVDVNRRVVASGVPIGAINTVRRHLSAIKGGRLAARVRGRRVTLVYSDVSPGALTDVASGPTLADNSTAGDAAAILERVGGCDRIVTALREHPAARTVDNPATAEVVLVADNDTLTSTAGAIVLEHGLQPLRWKGQLEGDVTPAAAGLVSAAERLRDGEVIVAGGETTVTVRGKGKGGRCSELAVRFAAAAAEAGLGEIAAIFVSSDGLDGNSGAAGVAIDRIPRSLDRAALDRALATSDSYAFAERIGRGIMIPPAGNNLRDLYLLARGWQAPQ